MASCTIYLLPYAEFQKHTQAQAKQVEDITALAAVRVEVGWTHSWPLRTEVEARSLYTAPSWRHRKRVPYIPLFGVVCGGYQRHTPPTQLTHLRKMFMTQLELLGGGSTLSTQAMGGELYFH